MELRIENSFELLSQEEWDKYLGVDLFEDMKIKYNILGASEDIFKSINAPRLSDLIQEYNNKVGELCISYALCRHYYDKGIPDEPWYKSPGNNGASITYFPNFSEEHWMRHFWFDFFSDTFYLKMFATWDSIIEIIDEYYQYGIKKDLRFRTNVMKELEKDNPKLVEAFKSIQKNEMYVNANIFRTAAAHGTSASEVSNTVQVQRDITVDIPKFVNGISTTESVKANRIISYSAGSYTSTDTIIKNMEDFTRFSGHQIQEIINLMET